MRFSKAFIIAGLMSGSLLATGCSEASADKTEKADLEKTETAPAVEEKTEEPEQEDKSKRKSPPAQAMNTIDGVKVLVDYSQPSVNGREVYGGLVPYGEIWRTGANEATWIEFDADVMIGGKKVAAGKYALFTIPQENGDWTLILNEEHAQWGAYKYDESKDVVRTTVTPTMGENMEKLTFKVADNVMFAWGKVSFTFDVKKA